MVSRTTTRGRQDEPSTRPSRSSLILVRYPDSKFWEGLHYAVLCSSCKPHCNENPIYVFLFWELRGLSPNFNMSDLYSPRIGLPYIFPRTETPIFLFWEYLYQIFGILSLSHVLPISLSLEIIHKDSLIFFDKQLVFTLQIGDHIFFEIWTYKYLTEVFKRRRCRHNFFSEINLLKMVGREELHPSPITTIKSNW
jgi:hypothetical protein